MLCFTKSLLYSILVTASWAAKIIHLGSHRHSLPILLFVLYLPTFFLPDVALAIVCRVLLPNRSSGSYASAGASLLVSVLSIVTLFASASQIAFYVETGGEIRWSAARNFAHDPAGMKLLASGFVGVALVIAAITCVATLLNPWLYHRVGSALAFVVNVFSKSPRADMGTLDQERQAYHDDPAKPEALLDTEDESPATPPSRTKLLMWRVLIVAGAGLIIFLQLVRPKHSPFGHLSSTLPFSLYQMFDTSEAAVCQGNSGPLPFPKPELLRGIANDTHLEGGFQTPSWLPANYTAGFDRFYWRPGNDSIASDQWRPYDPRMDPLKISNLQKPIFDSLRTVFDSHDVLIKHVVLFHLESTRQDAFPLKKGSHLHDLILKETGDFDSVDALNAKLARISFNAELLTGVSGGLDPSSKPDRSSGWRKHLADAKGGINVVGTATAGTATLKSLIGSICGADPLPVDFTEEAGLSIYQPCLPHVLNMFSRNKKSVPQARSETVTPSEYRKAVLSRPWHPVFAQAITDQFDRQDVLSLNMGFNQTIARSTIMDPESKHFPPQEPESNYFGYPEPELKPYLRDLFVDAEKAGQRLFLSHLTSTTHHPWHVPDSYGVDEEYLSRYHWREERPLNAYLNTLRYQDQWISDFMDLLEELGVLDETLVVFAGDHGMAFQEDSQPQMTFENPHIVNFRVPLTFFHPQLPRVQLNVSATSLSILPTVLDLLTQTGSLDEDDREAATALVGEYEGQSFLRPYIAEDHEREAWQFSIINAGAALLSVASAAVPWRLVLPLCKAAPYRFTNLDEDPSELKPMEFWTMPELLRAVEAREGPVAASWVGDAEKLGLWWASEQKQKWKYTGASRQDDKAPERHQGVGRLGHDHWWNT